MYFQFRSNPSALFSKKGKGSPASASIDAHNHFYCNAKKRRSHTVHRSPIMDTKISQWNRTNITNLGVYAASQPVKDIPRYHLQLVASSIQRFQQMRRKQKSPKTNPVSSFVDNMQKVRNSWSIKNNIIFAISNSPTECRNSHPNLSFNICIHTIKPIAKHVSNRCRWRQIKGTENDATNNTRKRASEKKMLYTLIRITKTTF